MKKVYIIHRWSGGPNDDWRPWLKQELEKRGYQVFSLAMPDPYTPVIKKWVDKIAEEVGTLDEETFFVGHSIGCQAILRYLETVDTQVGGAFFVAGWFDLHNLEDEEVKEIAKPWIETKIDLEKVENNLQKSCLFISDNDPYGCFDLNKEKFNELGSEIIVLPNAGHITEDDGFKELPVLLENFN